MSGAADLVQLLGDKVGIGPGTVMFVLACFLALFLTIPVTRSRGRRNSTQLRLYSIATGIAILFLVCGKDTWIMLLQVALGYLGIRCFHPRHCHIMVFVTSLGILALVHFRRLFAQDWIDDGFDISFPLMVSTQKLTLLGFGIHDGYQQSVAESRQAMKEAEGEEESSSARRRGPRNAPTSGNLPSSSSSSFCRFYHVRDPPSLLLYLDYLLYFQGVLIGPPCFFPDFVNYLNSREERPSRKNFLYRNLLLVIFYASVYVSMKSVFPVHYNKDPSIFLHWSFSYRLWFAVVSLFVVRFKFYCAWTAGESLQVAAGLGFNSATRKWNKLRNVDPWGLELATSPKSYIDCWNMRTNEWLRYLAYSRLSRKWSMVATFVLSAVWHGFYPGYYFTFLFAIPVTIAARKLRRCLRPWFILKERRKRAYDVITWVGTQVVLSMVVMPFILLDFQDSVAFTIFNQYGWFHITTLLVLLLPLPNLQKLLPRTDSNGAAPRREAGPM